MPVDGSVTFTAYTTYPSGYLVVNENGKFSKHYYAGSEKVLSRIGDQTAVIFEAKPKTATTETQSTEETTSEPLDEDALRDSQIADLTDILEKADMGTPVFKDYEPEEDEETPADEPVNGERAAATPMASPLVNLYYYHPNHLGSGTYLTDANGQLYQFYLNLPFGETMAEQHSLTEDYESPYKFNGKELDTDTGYYYYGARFYDPRTSIWLSTDPLMEKYPNVNPYVYCYQNPINIIDPTGMEGVDGWVTTVNTDGTKSHTYDPNVNTCDEADAAGYTNVEGVYESVNVAAKDGSYSYNLNNDGSVTNGLYGNQNVTLHSIYGTGQNVMVTEGGTAITTSTGVSSKIHPQGGQITSMEFSSPFFPWGAVIGSAAKGIGAFSVSTEVSGGGAMFFENATYSSKVIRQMGMADDIYHAFPKGIDGFATKFGSWSTKIGADGKPYQWLELSGSYGGRTGTFEYIKDANGVINHRFFNVKRP